jgi:hypothetical protein
MDISKIDQITRIETFPKVAGKRGEAKIVESEVDKVSISAEAKEAQVKNALVKVAQQAMDKIPDVRKELVELAKNRLSDGFYDSADVAKQIAERLVR